MVFIKNIGGGLNETRPLINAILSEIDDAGRIYA